MLTITNLDVRLGGKKILQGITLSLASGRVALLLGKSGSGKSTLLRTIASLEKPEVGTILYEGQPLNRQDVGMVFQQFNLFENLTVRENIVLSACYGYRRLDKQKAEQAAQQLLQQFDLESIAERYPNRLSGGQKQRVALARSLIGEPRIICLDEPTSALDPLLTHNVAKMIMQLATKGYCVIVTTHDISLVDRLDADLFLLREGVMIQQTTTRAFKANRTAFQHLYEFTHYEE